MPSCLLLLTRAQFSTCGFRLAFIPAILKIVIASSSNSSSAEWTSWVLAARALSATISRLLSYSSCSGSVRDSWMYVCLASISPWRQNNEFSSSKRKGRHWKKLTLSHILMYVEEIFTSICSVCTLFCSVFRTCSKKAKVQKDTRVVEEEWFVDRKFLQWAELSDGVGYNRILRHFYQFHLEMEWLKGHNRLNNRWFHNHT